MGGEGWRWRPPPETKTAADEDDEGREGVGEGASGPIKTGDPHLAEVGGGEGRRRDWPIGRSVVPDPARALVGTVATSGRQESTSGTKIVVDVDSRS
jgi:hypothetical protein